MKKDYNPFLPWVMLPAVALGLVLGFGIDAASAHTPTVDASCRVLTVDLVAYEPESVVTITVDGQSSSYGFDGAFHKAIPWTPDAAHTWLVRVDNRGDGKSDEWDFLRTGTSTACVTSTTRVVNVDLTPTTTVDQCAALYAYFQANPSAPKVDGWDYQCSPQVMDPPVVLIPPQVESRTVTPAVQNETVLAFTGPGHLFVETGIALALIVAAGVCLALSNRAANRKAVEPPAM